MSRYKEIHRAAIGLCDISDSARIYDDDPVTAYLCMQAACALEERAAHLAGAASTDGAILLASAEAMHANCQTVGSVCAMRAIEVHAEGTDER